MEKKLGPITITNEEHSPDIEHDNVFFDQLWRWIGVLCIMELGFKSIRGERIETYGTVAGVIMIVTSMLYVIRKINQSHKSDIVKFTNRFFWVSKKNKEVK